MPHMPLPLLILSAPILGLIGLVIFKYVQVRRARSWLAVPGKIVSAKSVMRKVRRNGADPGDDDTELRNFADIAYEFTVENHQVRGSRVSIGEDLGNLEVAETLARYPAGRSVTVYYNPANPEQAVLEREMPEGAFKFMTWLIVLLLSIVVLSVTGVSQIADAVRASIPNPKNAPFVIGFLLFALFTSLIGLALRRQAGAIKSWPKTTGRIVSSDVEQFRSRETGRERQGPTAPNFVNASVIRIRSKALLMPVTASTSAPAPRQPCSQRNEALSGAMRRVRR